MKRLSIVLTVLAVVSVANADLILTVNGLDAAKEPLEIEGKDNLVIAVAGSTESDANDYSVTATGGVLESITDPNTVNSKAETGDYLFTFEDKLALGTVNLIANQNMIIDDVSVEEGDTIYELVLFYVPETDTVIAFGINLESLSYIPPEPEPEPEPEPQPEPKLQPEPEPNEPGEPNEPNKPNEPNEPKGPGEPNEPSEPNLPGEPNEPNEPNETEIEPPTLKKVLLNCPDNISILPIPDFNRVNLEFLSFPSKDIRGPERTFTMSGSGGGGGMIMGMDGVIDINSDITSNTMWTADNTYHVVADVNVQALLVIEPRTVVQFASSGSMSVNNGGTLISVGTPNSPIIYTSDAVEPWFGDYYCPIYIEETASDSTKVTYSYIEYAYIGIMVEGNRLDTDIENNYLYHNAYGIVEYGTEHTDVSNNLIFKSYYSGIEVSLADANGQASSDSFILIENNTCDFYQDCGITVHGVPDSNDAGVVVLANNIVSESYQYGLNLVDGYMYASVLNTGYYDNASNKNWEFEEDNPAIETQFPYRDGTGYIPICYLDQDCNFIDAGYQYIEETQVIGKTTDVNDEPDANYIDIGFHYPNWQFSNAGDGNTLETDFNRDLIVNFEDFAILATGWEITYDINDLATLAGEWLNIVSAHPNISVYISGDPCNLSGDVTVGVDGIAYATEQAFALIDGEPAGAIEYSDDEEYIILDSRTFRNGQHTIKVVAVDPNDLITLSENTTVNFNNELYCISGDNDFEEGEDYHISAMYSSGYNLRVKVVDWNDSVVWTSQGTSGHLNLTIPENVFSGQIYDLVVEADSASWETLWKKGIGKKHVPGTLYKFAVFLPRGRNTFGRSSSESRKKAVAEVVRICETKGWPYVVLYRGQCNWGNFCEVLSHTSVKYVYLVCHSGAYVDRYKPTEVQRTYFKISSSRWFGCDRVVSYKGGLPGNMETSSRVHSMASLGLGQITQLRLVQVDGCEMAEFPDMAQQWINFNEVPILEQLYSGYKIKIKDFDPWWQKWSYDLWNELSDSGTTYWQAFQEIQKPQNNEKGYEIAEAVQWYGSDQVRLNW